MMRKRWSSIVWGIIIIAAAVLILLNKLDVFSIGDYVGNWWALFIIIPCLASMIEHISFWNVGGLLIGLVFLLKGWIEDALSINPTVLIWPIILVCLGLSIIFHRNSGSGGDDDKNKEYTDQSSPDGIYDYSVVFSGNGYNIKGNVNHLKANAVFGGIDLNLAEATVADGTRLKLSAVFGGIDVILPKNINLVTNGTPVFGGIDAKNYKNPNNVVSPTVYLDYSCVFGGIDIKTAK